MQVKEDSLGHRKRLREKFLKSGLAGFQDYEIVELLLSLGRPRRDCKPQAKEAIRRFKNLKRGVGSSTGGIAKNIRNRASQRFRHPIHASGGQRVPERKKYGKAGLQFFAGDF